MNLATFIGLLQENGGGDTANTKVYVSNVGIVLCASDGYRIGMDLPEFIDHPQERQKAEVKVWR